MSSRLGEGVARRPSRLHARAGHPRRSEKPSQRDLNRRHGVDVDPATVMIMPGGKPTMFFAMLMFGEPGTEILYPTPGFPIYRSMIEFTGATPVPYRHSEENGFAFSADECSSARSPTRPASSS
jgi:aspartate aminotransferase